jgi:FKBP-type peptidyl-prolyl cis-trans isomerase FklB
MSVSDKLKALMQQKENQNLQTGEAFLAENAKKQGMVVLASGLQYEILVEGAGAKPSAQNTVTCHYHGTVIGGEVFDSSVQRGQPASFPLNAVIKGWTEALQLMPTGSKWRLYLPPHLAYGNRQVSRVIGPNSTLIFEVELISFK